MKTLDEIKQLMAAGETAQADEALKDLLAAEPDNLQAKMLYGTCRQLLGDEETFRRIHEDLASEMEKLVKEEPKAETVSLWKKYHVLWMTLIIAGLMLAGTVGAMCYFGKTGNCQITEAMKGLSAYDDPEYDPKMQIQNTRHLSLYAGPPNKFKFTKTSEEDVPATK